jgi:RecJ-like exonuclease
MLAQATNLIDSMLYVLRLSHLLSFAPQIAVSFASIARPGCHGGGRALVQDRVFRQRCGAGTESPLVTTSMNPSRDDFAAMLDAQMGGSSQFEGRVVKGRITAIENDMVVVDVGLKSEGRIALREFAPFGQKPEIAVGDEIEVYVDRIENSAGEAMLSRDPGTNWKASSKKASAWMAPSLAVSKAASRLTLLALWRFCQAARWISVRCAM